MLQGDVVEDTASQDDVAALLRGVLQCPLGAVQAAESGAQGSESLLDHTVSRRMGHVVAIFGWSFRNVKWSHKPGAEKEGAVTFKMSGLEVPCWLSTLRVWHCHWCGSSYCCGEGSLPG